MAPNTINDEEFTKEPEKFPKLVAPQADSHKFRVSYFNVALMSYWHISALYGLYLCCTSASWSTIVYTLFLAELARIGTYCGAHRLWTHKSFKVKQPLEIILLIMQTIGGQNSVFTWVRDHRMHHRYSDTDADPHNPTRGFFFSHIGHLLAERHPEVKRRGRHVDMSDITSNPLLMFQRKHAFIIFMLGGQILPTIIPVYFWNETLNVAYHANILRHIYFLHGTFLVNSFAHKYGYRPYDKNFFGTDHLLSMAYTLGEGSHNYHHVFPWDYKGAETGSLLNISKVLIDFCARFGWAYDLKVVNPKIIADRVKRTGDESYGNVIMGM